MKKRFFLLLLLLSLILFPAFGQSSPQGSQPQTLQSGQDQTPDQAIAAVEALPSGTLLPSYLVARWGRALIAEQKRLDQGVMDAAIKDTAEKVAKQTTLVLSPQIAASQAQTAVESGRAERNKYIALIEAVLVALFGGYTGLHVFGLVK